jgi:uncharacterized coiled-coil protein SlyX
MPHTKLLARIVDLEADLAAQDKRLDEVEAHKSVGWDLAALDQRMDELSQRMDELSVSTRRRLDALECDSTDPLAAIVDELSTETDRPLAWALALVDRGRAVAQDAGDTTRLWDAALEYVANNSGMLTGQDMAVLVRRVEAAS